MSDVSAYITKFAGAVEAFNRGDVDRFADLLDAHCEFTASGTLLGSTGDECVAALKAGRDAGWATHNLLSIAGAGDYVISLFRNDFTDGSSLIGAGVHRLGPDGRVIEVRAFGPPNAAAQAMADGREEA